ncbi:TetR family transcriptional regulator [Actinomadura chokoriensis]|uniref:TetR family transcriptional regulator n=1 Tax=Actinomadura chokoriensis TaxID=454156 RepID=A0ABV4R105_9ACTN
MASTDSRRADSARDRVVAAARDEFARHGIAGARVDRIAKAARTSKERVYAHFRSKEKLYEHVAAAELAAAADAVHLDPADLPAYAGQMFDYFTAHPDRYRFIGWGRLELVPEPSGEPDADALGSYHDAILGKIETIRRAQRAGDLDPTWDPVDIMAVVSQIAHTWLDQAELAAVTRHAAADPTLPARREAVIRAVTAIFPPVRRSQHDGR